MIEINKVDFSSIPLDNALVIGNRKALHKVVVFSDPDCPYCGTLHQGIKQIIEKRKDIVFYIKLYPLPIHKDARRKAESIMCSHSLRMLDEAFEKKNIPDSTCTQTFIDQNIALAQKLGITGTPTIILDDGRIIPAFVQPDKLLALIDRRPL
jgi:thiol:disulfide interchange protein DsbC